MGGPYLRKILAPIKIKSALPPPPPKPPLKRGILWTRVFLQKERIFSRRPQNWRSHFRPQNCGHEFYGHEDFSDYLALSRIQTQVGVLNRLVLNRLGGAQPRDAKQKRDRGRDSQPRPRPRLNSQPQGATKATSSGAGGG